MAQNWPTRYRCRKCTRSTSAYPLFCNKPECPVKHDWWQDNWSGFIVFFLIIGVYILLLLGS